MSFKSYYSIFECTPIILFFASIFLLSCSVEDLAPQQSDSNQTTLTDSVAIESVKSLSNNKILSNEAKKLASDSSTLIPKVRLKIETTFRIIQNPMIRVNIFWKKSLGTFLIRIIRLY